jgi:hypothetical protein
MNNVLDRVLQELVLGHERDHVVGTNDVCGRKNGNASASPDDHDSRTVMRSSLSLAREHEKDQGALNEGLDRCARLQLNLVTHR